MYEMLAGSFSGAVVRTGGKNLFLDQISCLVVLKEVLLCELKAREMTSYGKSFLLQTELIVAC